MRPDSPGAHAIVLASSSPRRRLLLESAGFDVTTRPPEVDESALAGEGPEPYVLRIARAKHDAIAPTGGGAPMTAPLLAADTVVAQGGALLGKPAHRQEAEAMLRALSGGWHEVITGVCVGRAGEPPTAFAARTRVRFKRLRDEEIAWYLATREWRDKAGGYGVQGHGAFLVAALEGSYANVVGLPLAEVVDALAQLGVHPGSDLSGAAPQELLQ